MDTPLRIDLQDNGGGADQIANDGIYSRYFTQFDINSDTSRYTLRCQVKGDDDTMFVTQKNGALSVVNGFKGSTYPLKPSSSTAPVCCGGSTGNNLKTSPTGNFTRKSNGNSFKVTNVPSSDATPPIAVRNLEVKMEEDFVLLTFTAPGDDLDEGEASKYELKYSQYRSNFTASWDALDDSGLLTEDDLVHGTLDPIAGGKDVVLLINPDTFEENTIFYIGLKSTDDMGNTSPLSNIAQVFRANEDTEAPGTVNDLQVDVDENDSGIITVTFTAPGNDGHQGIAIKYEIKYSTEHDDMMDSNWDNISNTIKDSDIIEGSLNPVEGGENVKLRLKASLFEHDAEYFMAMRAYDNRTNGEMSNIAIVVRQSPSAVVDLMVTVDKHSTYNVIVNFTGPGNSGEVGTPQSYELKYSTSPFDINDENWGNINSVIITSDLQSGSLDPVKPGTTFSVVVNGSLFLSGQVNYMAMRSCDKGSLKSSVSNIASFARMPPNTLNDFNAEVDRSDTSRVTIQFTAPGNYEDMGKADKYEIKYAENQDSLIQWNDLDQIITDSDLSSGTLTPVDAGTKVKMTLKGETFNERRTYFIAMKAYGKGLLASDVSNIAKFTRLPPSSINDLDLNVNVADSSEIHMEFSAPGNSEDFGTASSYTIKSSYSPITDWNSDSNIMINSSYITQGSLNPVPSGQLTSLTLNGKKFSANTEYYIAMKTTGNGGLISDMSNIMNFERRPPSPVTDLDAVYHVSNESAILVTFTAPGNFRDPGIPANYEVKFSSNKTLLEEWTSLNESFTITEDILTMGSLIPTVAGTSFLSNFIRVSLLFNLANLSGSQVQVALNVSNFEVGSIYYLGMKSEEKGKIMSDLSNLAEFEVPTPLTDEGLSGGAIAGVVIGCLFIGFTVVVLGYFLVNKIL